jgi:uncharacterized protein YyaL (SSP411 family)
MAGIRWREWNASSFQEAKRRQVPVLLAIVSPWVAACRRMEISTFADSRVSTFVEGNLVPIRVDALDRPDIASRYAHDLPPVTAFLTPDGHLLTAAGYLDADHILSAIEKVTLYYRTNRDEIAREAAERDRKALLASEPQNPITPGAVRRVEEAILAKVEADPPLKLFPDAVHFLLLRHARTGSQDCSTAAEKMLESWASSPLYDKVDGGFFFHVSKPDFSDLELSKTCVDNAEAIKLYSAAQKLSKSERFETVSKQTCGWVLSTLVDERTGGFFAGQLPDAEYYIKGRRDHAHRPRAVEKIYTAPCASMARALLDAALVTGDKEMGRRALSAGELLWKECYDAELGMARRLEALLAERRFGICADQLAMLDLLIRIYEVGGHPLHLQRAIELGGLIESLYGDPGGGFYDRTPDDDDIGHLKFRKKSAIENGRGALLFYKLGALTHNDHFKEVAAAALWRFTAHMEDLGMIAAAAALACDIHLKGMSEVTVVGPRQDPSTSKLRVAVLELFLPTVAVGTIDAEDESTLRIRGLEYEGEPAGYIFHGGEKFGPIKDPVELREKVIALAKGG